MKVNNQNMQTIWFEDHLELVKIIDQTLLPFKIEIKELKSLEDSVFAIKNMLVRGAPLIGVTAAYGMFLASKKNCALRNSATKEKADIIAYLSPIIAGNNFTGNFASKNKANKV